MRLNRHCVSKERIDEGDICGTSQALSESLRRAPYSVPLLMQPGQAQSDRIEGIRLNHVGVWAKDLNESLAFYTKVMGFREGFVMKDPRETPLPTIFKSTKTHFWSWPKRPRIVSRGSLTWVFGWMTSSPSFPLYASEAKRLMMRAS